MSYEELVESRKFIGNMTKEELFEYCCGLLEEIWEFEKLIERLHNIIKEVREYIERTNGNFWIATSVKKELLEILNKE